MRPLIYFLSLIVVMGGVGAGSVRYGQVQQERRIQDGLHKDIIGLQDKISRLDGHDDAHMETVGVYYSALYEHIQMLFLHRDYAYGMDIKDLPAGMPLEQAAVPSIWEGVKKLTLQLRFTDIGDHFQDVHILNGLSRLREMYPLDIISIAHDAKGMGVVIDLYGK